MMQNTWEIETQLEGAHFQKTSCCWKSQWVGVKLELNVPNE